MSHVPEIRIMGERCVRCGGCLALCPQSGPDAVDPVFLAEPEGLRVAHSESCFACMTCVEFCRASAIVMTHKPPATEGQPDLYPTRPANKII